MTIAILGGYGDVGAAATRHLVEAGVGPLRVGGRNVAAAERFVAGLTGPGSGNPDVECRAADGMDEGSLAQFVRDCRVVVNCAGPSYRIGDRVAVAAERAGADYVDAAGDDALYDQLDDAAYRDTRRVAVVSAGLQPGLTSLLPRWLARRGFAEVTGLLSHVGLLDQFTTTAAEDYMRAMDDMVTEPLAAWEDGHRRSGALVRRKDVDLPFFPGPVAVLPYLDTEGERLARALGLTHGAWHTVVSGPRILEAFDRIAGLERGEAIALLRQASALDLAGRRPHAILVMQLDGRDRQGDPLTRTVVLHGAGNGALSGTVAARTAMVVAGGAVPPGRHFATDVLDPDVLMDGMDRVASVTCLDTPIENSETLEEGAL